MTPTIEYRTADLKELRVTTTEGSGPRSRRLLQISAGGETLLPGQRFWHSLFHRFGLNDQVFRYFSHDEVLDRVVQTDRDQRLRLCIERFPNGQGQLLAVSSPGRGVLGYEPTRQMLEKYDARELNYHDGILRAFHMPRSGERPFEIGPDRFHNRFVVEVPVDGWGRPRIYLSLLRLVCSNGAIGYSPAFRSEIRMGEDAAYTLERALSQFDHEEGFAALRQRFESAQKSWASVHETLRLRQLLTRWFSQSGGSLRNLPAELNRLAGDLHSLYGLANIESLSPKRQRVLPAKCRVYDLINFASEVATHRATGESRMRLQAYIGELIAEEYDLEGTAEKVPEFRDLFMHLN